MKLSQLRAAAHNLADSLSSECSTFLGFEPLGLWDHIDSRVDQRLEVDLLTGEILSPGAPAELQRRLCALERQAPEFLREQRCDPRCILRLRVELQRRADELPTRRQALVSIALSDGTSVADLYVGNPLRRGKYLDRQGRLRADRRRPVRPISPSAPAGGPRGR